MKAVAVYEAKTRLSELLVEVEQGEQFTITRRGAPVAYLSAVKPQAELADPAMATQRKRVRAAFAALDQLCQGFTLDVPWRDAIADGRD